MKAIETVYNNYRFRSRLEARYAVFFDALGVKYQYEPEGFDLGGEWYLPDFWLPAQQCWFEVKGEEPDDRAKRLASALSVASGKWVDVVYGSIGEQRVMAYRHYAPGVAHICEMGLCESCRTLAFGSMSRWENVDGVDCTVLLGHCYACGGGILGQGRAEVESIRNDPHLLGAYRIARQARFDEGDEERIKYEIKTVMGAE